MDVEPLYVVLEVDSGGEFQGLKGEADVESRKGILTIEVAGNRNEMD